MIDKMNKIVASLALVASILPSSCAMAQNDALVVKGEIKGLEDSLVVTDNPRALESAMKIAAPEGKINFTYDLKEPKMIYLAIPTPVEGGKRNFFVQLVAVPGETAEINGEVGGKYHTTGSKFYQEYDEADQCRENASKEMNAWIKGLQARMEAGDNRDSIMKEYQEKSPEYEQKVNNAIFDFIKQHPDYEACAALAAQQLQSADDIRKAVALLSPTVRDGRMKAIYNPVVSRLEAKEKSDSIAAAKQAPGVEAPDFTLNDINGKPLTLSSLRGKYVILDFWGSWCVWCIKGFPEMKNYYEKYKGKFEILGVDCRDTEEKWKAAVERHALPWLHVYCPRDNSKVLEDYAIQGFPTKIIIGPQGQIVKTIVGEDPQFYTLLDKLFGAD